MNKAVIYARYSSDSQTEQSIEGQLSECTRVCWERKRELISSLNRKAFNFSLLVFHFKTNPKLWKVNFKSTPYPTP